MCEPGAHVTRGLCHYPRELSLETSPGDEANAVVGVTNAGSQVPKLDWLFILQLDPSLCAVSNRVEPKVYDTGPASHRI